MKIELLQELDQCPHCDASMIGDPIPEDKRDEYYGGATHFRRNIGVEVQGVYDGILYYQCPDCGGQWLRFSEGAFGAHQHGNKVLLK